MIPLYKKDNDNILANNLLVYIILVLIILIGFGFWIYREALPDNSVEAYAPVGYENLEIVESEAPGFYIMDSELLETPGRVVLESTEELYKERNEYLSDYAILSLQEYLNRYVTYYKDLPKGEAYSVQYIKGSYEGDLNAPSFSIKINFEEPVTVNCIFDNYSKRYWFYSSLNE